MSSTTVSSSENLSNTNSRHRLVVMLVKHLYLCITGIFQILGLSKGVEFMAQVILHSYTSPFTTTSQSVTASEVHFSLVNQIDL